MNTLYQLLEKNKTAVKIVRKIRKIISNYKLEKCIKGKYKFINRQKGTKKMCMILTGYSPLIEKDVMNRMVKFIPKNIDVCILTSGRICDSLMRIAEENNWSYLSTKRNNVALIQNITINLFPKAEYFYKFDGDIFLTKDMFKHLDMTYKNVNENSSYDIGFVSALINVNGYGYVRILEKLNLIEDYSQKFGKPKYGFSNHDGPILTNSDVAKYLWGKYNKSLSNIDEISKNFGNKPFQFSVCPMRYSVGAILFTRNIWEQMGRFKVVYGVGMGVEEEQMCNFCMQNSKAIVISENTMVGHFAYGKQTNEMNKYYLKNRRIFQIKKL